MIRRFRPRLLVLTAIAASVSVIANAVGAVTAASAPPTRLGVSIQKDMADQARASADRNRALDMREQAARATEARLKADLEEKTAAATKAGPSADGVEPGEQYDSLSRVYQAMKPARAAAVFEQLEMDVQMQVAKRIRDRAMAMILANMTPKGAAALSMALARKSVPAAPVVTAAAKAPAVSPAAALAPAAVQKPR